MSFIDDTPTSVCRNSFTRMSVADWKLLLCVPLKPFHLLANALVLDLRHKNARSDTIVVNYFGSCTYRKIMQWQSHCYLTPRNGGVYGIAMHSCTQCLSALQSNQDSGTPQ